jgi:LacI family transcriptional regulator
MQAMKTETDPGDERPTLKTIAFLTGLGVTTVSRALKNGPEIGEETKERVRQIAKQVGYRPNRAGVRLRTGKTNVISLILNTEEGAMGLVSEMVYGITEALADTPYHLVITPYSLSDPMEPVRYIVETQSADGVIISRTEARDPRVSYLLEHHLPFATHGRTDMGVIHPWHDYDNESYAYNAVKLLAGRGRKRIGLSGPPPHLLYARHTARGFERAMRDFKLDVFPLSTLNLDAPADEIRRNGREIGISSDRPDGIVCSSAMSALGLVGGLEEAGLKIGRDIDIVTKQSSSFIGWYKPEILTIREDFRTAGRDLAKSVLAWIDGADPASLQHLVGPESAA